VQKNGPPSTIREFLLANPLVTYSDYTREAEEWRVAPSVGLDPAERPETD